jgi:hypothetical protein
MSDERPQERPPKEEPQPPLQTAYPNPLIPEDYSLPFESDDEPEDADEG